MTSKFTKEIEQIGDNTQWRCIKEHNLNWGHGVTPKGKVIKGWMLKNLCSWEPNLFTHYEIIVEKDNG